MVSYFIPTIYWLNTLLRSTLPYEKKQTPAEKNPIFVEEPEERVGMLHLSFLVPQRYHNRFSVFDRDFLLQIVECWCFCVVYNILQKKCTYTLWSLEYLRLSVIGIDGCTLVMYHTHSLSLPSTDRHRWG